MYAKYNTFLQSKIFNFDLLLSLRGLMAISVVFYHFFIDKEIIKSNFAKYFIFALDGSGAVLVFFILSGYLMFKLFATGRYDIQHLWKFYSARINRILPLYWGVLILVGLFIYGKFWLPGNRLDFIKLFTMTQYLDGQDFVLEKYRWFSVTWSLVIEMQFYLIVPALAWVLMKVKNLWAQVLLLMLFSGLAISDLVLKTGINLGLIGFFNRSILGYFPFFVTGGMVALILANHKKVSELLNKIVWALPILLIGIFALPAYTRIFQPDFNSNWVFVIFGILIIGIFESFSWSNKPAKWDYEPKDIWNIKKALEILGHHSFSIYIWHLFVIYQFGGWIIESNFAFLSHGQFVIFQKAVTMIGILFISFLSYHSIEKIKIFPKFKN
jgi:peptidoglycan/LPS O-acetylase OafA/YrhL